MNSQVSPRMTKGSVTIAAEWRFCTWQRGTTSGHKQEVIGAWIYIYKFTLNPITLLFVCISKKVSLILNKNIISINQKIRWLSTSDRIVRNSCSKSVQCSSFLNRVLSSHYCMVCRNTLFASADGWRVILRGSPLVRLIVSCCSVCTTWNCILQSTINCFLHTSKTFCQLFVVQKWRIFLSLSVQLRCAQMSAHTHTHIHTVFLTTYDFIKVPPKWSEFIPYLMPYSDLFAREVAEHGNHQSAYNSYFQQQVRRFVTDHKVQLKNATKVQRAQQHLGSSGNGVRNLWIRAFEPNS